MLIFKKTNQLTDHLKKAQQSENSIGFVPTMGALHAGHLSLIETCRAENELTVASIFVNPAQFNDQRDFEKYPVTIEKDIELLVKAGCDVLFLPSTEEIYPAGYNQPELYDLGYLETILEGKYRPGHFQGVCKVMNRLLDIVQPANLYMGQKDYQQCMVVKRLLAIMAMPVSLHTCPTLREADGLAMSSRNTRLNPIERKNAAAIFLALNRLKASIEPGSLAPLINKCSALLAEHDFNIDYISVADAHTLALVNEWNGKQKIVALAAAFQHEVRLIDNLLLN